MQNQPFFNYFIFTISSLQVLLQNAINKKSRMEMRLFDRIFRF